LAFRFDPTHYLTSPEGTAAHQEIMDRVYPKQDLPNQVPVDTAHKLADPQH